MPESGRKRLGGFEIQTEIEAGAFGMVCRTSDPRGNPLTSEFIWSDATPAPALVHPNILTAHIFPGDGALTEDLTGSVTLDKTDRLSFSIPYCISVMTQVGEALAHAHQNGFVHRHLAPLAIHVWPDGSVKVEFFPFVEPAFTETDYRYWAPEHFTGGEVDARSDVFSFGVIFYQIVTGTHPFEAPNKITYVKRLLLDVPVPLRSHVAECPPGLERIIWKTLARDPEWRYASMLELMTDLEQTLIPGRLARVEQASRPAPFPPVRPATSVEKPSPEWIDNVQFSVFRPRAIAPERWETLLAFVHRAERPTDAPSDEPDPVEEVKRQAERVLGEDATRYQQLTQDSSQAIPKEGELTFVPRVPGILFNPPARSFVWMESVHREEFRMRASFDLDGHTARGSLSVFLGSIIVAEVPLNIRVAGALEQRPGVPLNAECTSAYVYRKIFASYSRKDQTVVQEFREYARAMGDQYLVDVMELRSGEVWDDRLLELIRQAGVFQLFWSSNSMHSEFVSREYGYALSLGRQNFVRPVYWEEPLPEAPAVGLPPEELRRIHFQRVYPRLLPTPVAEPPSAAAPSRARAAAPRLRTMPGRLRGLFPPGAAQSPLSPPTAAPPSGHDAAGEFTRMFEPQRRPPPPPTMKSAPVTDPYPGRPSVPTQPAVPVAEFTRTYGERNAPAPAAYPGSYAPQSASRQYQNAAMSGSRRRGFLVVAAVLLILIVILVVLAMRK